MKDLLIFGAVGLVLYHLWNRSNFNYNIVGIKLAPLRIVFDIYNPTNSPITFNSILADVLYNGNRIGILNNFGNTTIPANSHATVDIQVGGDVVGFIGFLNNIIAQGLKNIIIQIQGTINVGGISLPINKDYKLAWMQINF